MQKFLKRLEINRKKESVHLPIFPLQSGNEIRQNIFQWQSLFTVRFGSARRTMVGVIDNYLFNGVAAP